MTPTVLQILPAGTMVYPLHLRPEDASIVWRHTVQELKRDVILRTYSHPPSHITSPFPNGLTSFMYLFPTPIEDKKVNNMHGPIIGFLFLENCIERRVF
jgi:hypothetical protein